MELVKDIFFFAGSVLGILAFLKTVIEPMVESNKLRWKQVSDHISEEDFINLESEIWYARRVHDETWNKVRGFVRDIEEGVEYLRFNSICKKSYRKILRNIRKLFWDLSELIQVPYWEPHSKVDDEGNEFRFYSFNKEYFLKESESPDDYADHLEAAAEIAERLRIEFRKLSVLSNLHVIQVPFAKKLVAKEAQIPKRSAAFRQE